MSASDSTFLMRIRYWDVPKDVWETLIVTVPGRPNAGPSDDYLVVVDAAVQPDAEGNFISEDYTEQELDSVHTFAIARLTIDLWEKALKKKVTWPWNDKGTEYPLRIVIDPTYKNAGYHLAKEAIFFGDYGDARLPTCRSLDIVAHETTHALIESYRPDIHYINTVEAFAVVEALADISPILLQASIPNIFSKAIKPADDLTQINSLSEFADGYSGKGIGGIRSALKPVTEGKDSYAIGSSLVHTVYKKMVEEWEKSPSPVDFHEGAKKFAQLILRPILNMKKISPENYISLIY